MNTSTNSPQKIPHVVIIGGGFAGLYAARALAKARWKTPVRVTLLDRRNHHLFQPLLYQVATAALSAGEIAVPIRAVLSRYRNVQVFLAEVSGIDIAARRVRMGDVGLDYDYLVVAAGAQTAYFGRDDWAEFAPGLKNVEDALEIRRRILCSFEAAERMPLDSDERRQLLTFCIVGGGPTGVEMAGAIAEIARQTLKNDFRTIDPMHTRVILVQSGDRVLNDYPEALSESAKKQLEARGVEVHLGPRVSDIAPGVVKIGDDIIHANTIIWTAGVAASPLGAMLGVPVDKGGRVVVEPDLSVPGYPEVFVTGDLANYSHQTGEPLPGLSPVAIKEGEAAARNILKTERKQKREKFHYRDKGSMATIGRAAAVANMYNRFQLTGILAWLAWLFVHIYFLIGFYNRIIVMFRWGWAYVASNRGARLITGAGCSSMIPEVTSAATPSEIARNDASPSLNGNPATAPATAAIWPSA